MRVAAAVVVREEVIAQQVRVYLAQDRLNEAEALLVGEGFSFAGRISRVESASGGSNPQAAAVLFAAALRILLHRARTGREGEGLKSGLELADAMAAGALQGGYVPFAIEMLLLRARLHAAAGNDEPSRTDYLKALELAQPEGMISVFVEGGESVAAAFADLLARDRLEGIHPDFVKTVLAAFSGSAAPAREAGAELPEQLTDRERDVLRLISEGLRYEDVADRLCISLNTVRSHIKAIYGKLGVNNRTRAIETAHQMQIL
jgi:LuxR family maltose regulon positive regulatory protein